MSREETNTKLDKGREVSRSNVSTHTRSRSREVTEGTEETELETEGKMKKGRTLMQ